ncbi:putative snare protein YKT6 [Paratrimastix pyriformis]|uniref:Snare protein YKT6 n=1 Tax=Paratrimastix pyriformis TaxID=342808 RepID=A0ABQ8UMY1_9EUKA|nr:putative snare protein YKT6 [Paratrimastix pyriformis]|eukprot:GAFH01004574.1.p2 GENE.GAFH01004574.1~~GAFH01004574.1.p2  ORF type:complete len:218 (-),score=14.28 GAFH01004574.1:111-740(-)
MSRNVSNSDPLAPVARQEPPQLSAILQLQRPGNAAYCAVEEVNVLGCAMAPLPVVARVAGRQKVEAILRETACVCVSKLANNLRAINCEDVHHIFYCYMEPSGKCAAVACNPTYPQRAAFAIAMQVAKDPRPNLPELLRKYQNPMEADRLLRLNHEIDQVRDVMNENINKILERGEKIEDVLERSQRLDDASKKFLKNTKKLNRCCVVM